MMVVILGQIAITVVVTLTAETAQIDARFFVSGFTKAKDEII